MSERDEAKERASKYISSVFCEAWKSVAPSFKSVNDERFIFALCGQLEALYIGATARLDQEFKDESLRSQFLHEHHLLDELLGSFEEYGSDEFELFCRYYQPTHQHDPLIALDLVKYPDKI